jgi:hypothetical protein
MSDKLQGLLLGYIRENNPDLLFQLEQDDALHAWVCDKIQEVELVLDNAKPIQVSDSAFMDIFKADLHPSRFRYVRDLFETEFTDQYERMREAGTLHYELVNMVSACHGLFAEMPLVEDMPNAQLDHAVAGVIHDYLEMEVE